MAVYDAAAKAVARARAGEGPTLMECKTFRFEAHCGVTRENKRRHENPDQQKEWVKRDPIAIFEKRLVGDGVMTADEQAAMKEAVMKEVKDAEAFARKSAYPTMQSVEARLV
jgi:pyruvate dehydrogenase E1 component alpha subunit